MMRFDGWRGGGGGGGYHKKCDQCAQGNNGRKLVEECPCVNQMLSYSDDVEGTGSGFCMMSDHGGMMTAW